MLKRLMSVCVRVKRYDLLSLGRLNFQKRCYSIELNSDTISWIDSVGNAHFKSDHHRRDEHNYVNAFLQMSIHFFFVSKFVLEM